MRESEGNRERDNGNGISGMQLPGHLIGSQRPLITHLNEESNEK